MGSGLNSLWRQPSCSASRHCWVHRRQSLGSERANVSILAPCSQGVFGAVLSDFQNILAGSLQHVLTLVFESVNPLKLMNMGEIRCLLSLNSREYRVVGNAINIHNISKHHKERFPTPAYLLNSTVPQRTNLLSLSKCHSVQFRSVSFSYLNSVVSILYSFHLFDPRWTILPN